MHVGVDFSELFVIFSLHFGRKWAQTRIRVCHHHHFSMNWLCHVRTRFSSHLELVS
jgi:hypothetical protein